MSDLATAIVGQIVDGMNPQNQMVTSFLGTQSLTAQAQAVSTIGPLRQKAEDDSAPQSVKDASDRILNKLGK
jgi:hypothetical protein